ncbi:hypothetical protein HYZ41_03880 [archaeon]|nr:hypothetical protein [archaeon]
MRIEEHKKALEEHERNIRRCIDEGLEENQRNLGYNISQACIEMLSIYLIKMRLVPLSVNFDHRLFKSSKAFDSALKIDFPSKSKILGLMKGIEERRNYLCYGKRKSYSDCEEMVELYNKLKDVIGDL